MTFRFMPVSICIRGDIGIFDRVAIDEINALLRAALEARGEPPDRYELSVLNPEQFVRKREDDINWRPIRGNANNMLVGILGKAVFLRPPTPTTQEAIDARIPAYIQALDAIGVDVVRVGTVVFQGNDLTLFNWSVVHRDSAINEVRAFESDPTPAPKTKPKRKARRKR